MGSGGTVTWRGEIARVARGISGVVLGDSRLDGGATPEPGKEGVIVCTLMSWETDLSQLSRRFIKCVGLSLVA